MQVRRKICTLMQFAHGPGEPWTSRASWPSLRSWRSVQRIHASHSRCCMNLQTMRYTEAGPELCGAPCRQVRTTLALTLSFVVEKADEQILPAGRLANVVHLRFLCRPPSAQCACVLQYASPGCCHLVSVGTHTWQQPPGFEALCACAQRTSSSASRSRQPRRS